MDNSSLNTETDIFSLQNQVEKLSLQNKQLDIQKELKQNRHQKMRIKRKELSKEYTKLYKSNYEPWTNNSEPSI